MEKKAKIAEIIAIMPKVCTQQAMVCNSSNLLLSISSMAISRSSLESLSKLYSGVLDILSLLSFNNYNTKRGNC